MVLLKLFQHAIFGVKGQKVDLSIVHSMIIVL